MSTILKNLYWDSLTRARILANRQWPAWHRFFSLKVKGYFGRRGNRVAHKLLLLTWEFPPMVSGGVYRPISFVRYAAESGWDVNVVCGPAPIQPSNAGLELEKQLPSKIPVQRVAADQGSHPWPLPLIDGGILNALTLYEKAASMMKADADVGVILASGPPFHSFVAAAWLAQRFGWKLVLDYRDEWTQSPHGFNRCDKVNQLWENRCLRQADRVLFTTHSQLDHQLRIFPDLEREKCLVIHNGWEPQDFLDTENVAPSQSEVVLPVRLSFFGNLGGWWHPEDFLKTLEKTCVLRPDFMRHIEILLVGNKPTGVAEILQRYVEKVPIRLIDHQTKTEVCSMMRTTDILLLLNPPSLSRYIPGKIYEYIASGSPILLYGEGGEMANIVESLCVGIVVPSGDAAALGNAIDALKAWQPPINDTTRSAWLESRTRRHLALQLLGELEVLNKAEVLEEV